MASSCTNGFPNWMLRCKDHITRTTEWETYVDALQDAIRQQLTESHVKSFIDLTYPEKTLFLDRAVHAVTPGNVTSNLVHKLSLLMDQRINEEVSQSLLEDWPSGTKTDLVLRNAEEGAVCLLRKWPDMMAKLKVCFNQSLPQALRQLTWRLNYANDPCRKSYLDTLSKKPRSAVSRFDLEITQKCEQIIDSQPNLTYLRGSIGAFYAMKAVLSYFNSLSQHENARLLDSDFLLVIPFVYKISNTLSRNRDVYVKQMTNEDYRAFLKKIIEIIERRDPNLLEQITLNLKSEDEITTESGLKSSLMDVLHDVIKPVVRCLFVGYLNMETVLYVWDQYVLGFDSPEFHREYLAVVTATMILLLKSSLVPCSSVQEFESAIAVESRKLTAAQFQFEIKKNDYQHLWGLLICESKSHLPALDPTQAQQPHWRHWYNDVIPPYTQPHDRKRAREEREAQRERLLQQQKEVEQTIRDQEDREKSELQRLRLQSAADKQHEADKARRELEQLLADEHKKHLESEKAAKAEMEKLKMELDLLKNKQTPESAITLVSSVSRILVPPPPSAATHTSHNTIEIPHSLSPTTDPHLPANTVMTDLFQRLANCAHKIAHGDGDEKDTLNEETKIYMKQHIADVKRAEMEIYNHQLTTGEFEQLSPKTQKTSSEEIMRLIRQYRQQRIDI